jgi:putative transposase
MILPSGSIKDVIYLLFDLLTTLAKLLRPGGSRTVIAEHLVLNQQLIIHSRTRQRAPSLTNQDRAVLGFLLLFLNARRLARSAIITKPLTLFTFHKALKQ